MPAFFCEKCGSRVALPGACDACDPGGQPHVLEIDGALVSVASLAAIEPAPAAPPAPKPKAGK